MQQYNHVVRTVDEAELLAMAATGKYPRICIQTAFNGRYIQVDYRALAFFVDPEFSLARGFDTTVVEDTLYIDPNIGMPY